ncbi:MAG: hypothetical protein H6807_10325 [Planctomycetes bacterium]|nr:hypothetical protein [Planctomycetota bacterium]
MNHDRRGLPASRVALLFLCVVLGGHSTFAQEKHAGRKGRHQAFLWLDRGFSASDELVGALRDLGIAGTNVAGTAPATVQGRHGIPFYVDHVAGKGFLYLPDASWEEDREAWQADQELRPRPRRPSLRSADALGRALARIDEVLDALGHARPIALSLDDEISIGRRNVPIDLGYEAPMIAAFREHLRKRYPDDQALARAWDIEPTPLAEVEPFSTQAIRKREFLKESLHQNFAPWADYREFLDEDFARVVAELVRRVRLRTGATPVGFTGGEAPHPFSGVDWARLLELVDFCEPYDVGGSRELVRSFAREDALVMRTLFEDPRHPRANEHEIWDYFLRGDRGLILWAASRVFAAPDDLAPSAWAERLAPTLRAVSAPGLDGFLAARPPAPRIAILESQASDRLHWMFDSRSDGPAWIHRLGSYEQEHASQNLCREAWQKLLEDLHLDYEHVSTLRLDRRRLAPYDVVILPRAIALSDREGRILEDFARRGTLIADCQTGLFDEQLRARPQGLLDELFGITRRNRLVNLQEDRPIDRGLDGPPGLRLAEPGIEVGRGAGSTMRFGKIPAMVTRRHGNRGRSVYLNLLVQDYLEQRLRGSGEALLDELRGVFRMTRVHATVEVRGRDLTSPPLRVFRRHDDDADYLALLWNWRQSARALAKDELEALKPTTIDLLLPTATSIELIVGREQRVETSNDAPRRRSSITLEIDPFAPVILRLEGLSDDVRDR